MDVADGSLVFVELDVQHLPLSHPDAGMPTLVALVAVMATKIAKMAGFIDRNLVDGEQPEALALEVLSFMFPVRTGAAGLHEAVLAQPLLLFLGPGDAGGRLSRTRGVRAPPLHQPQQLLPGPPETGRPSPELSTEPVGDTRPAPPHLSPLLLQLPLQPLLL